MRRTLCALALCLAAVQPALAGPVSDAATAHEAAPTVSHFEALAEAAWEAMPLQIAVATPVEGDPQGYGIYDPRPTHDFALGEPVVIYVEPMGFGHGVPAPGVYNIAFQIDLEVLMGAKGPSMAKIPDIMSLGINSHHKNREFHAVLTYNIEGLGPGDYTLRTTLNDVNSGQSASFDTPIRIAP